MLLKSKYFWISTTLFLILAVAISWFVYPPLVKQFTEQRQKAAQLNQEIEQYNQYLSLVRNLQTNEQTLNTVYDQALTALPTSANSDLLLLQLDGLLNESGVTNSKINVPFGSSVPATPGAAANQKFVFTVTGNMDYATVGTVATKLRTFARWNKITALEIKREGDTSTATISAEAFSKPLESAEFTQIEPDFLKKAGEFFAAYQSYTSKPDAETEGNFGRSNPFN